MNRIAQIDLTEATDKTKRLFDDVQARLGIVPNLFRVLANAPAALEGFIVASRTYRVCGARFMQSRSSVKYTGKAL